MKRWPHVVGCYNLQQIQTAVNDVEWQTFRKSLKGLTTEAKLERLDRYLKIHINTPQALIQVANYINALKRSGHLDINGRVQQ